MKKLFLLLAISVVGSVSAKGYDGSTNGVVGSCMVKVDDENTRRFLNVAYIRSIEIEIKDEYNKAKPNIVIIKMASNYAAKTSYSINYGTEAKAMEALQKLSNTINDCGLNSKQRD